MTQLLQRRIPEADSSGAIGQVTGLEHPYMAKVLPGEQPVRPDMAVTRARYWDLGCRMPARRVTPSQPQHKQNPNSREDRS